MQNNSAYQLDIIMHHIPRDFISSDLQAVFGETAFAFPVQEGRQPVDPRPHPHGGGGEIGAFMSKSAIFGVPGVVDESVTGFTIELKSGGKVTIDVDGTTAQGKWVNDDKTITLTVENTDIVGKLGKDTITFENFLQELIGISMDLKFAKEGTDAAPLSRSRIRFRLYRIGRDAHCHHD